MGIHKFRLPPQDLMTPPGDLRKGYIAGSDRTPTRTLVEMRPGLLVCHREVSESGRFNVPWPVPGFGLPMLASATLVERPQAYDLMVEMARGKLNELRNQLADWKLHLNLQKSPELEELCAGAHDFFAQAATRQDQPEESFHLARESLMRTLKAGELAVAAYAQLLFRLRHHHTPELPTLLYGTLTQDPQTVPWREAFLQTFNAARLAVSWHDLAPQEGVYHWDLLDAQVAWCQEQGLPISAGPLLEFRPSALPDWLWLFQGDHQTLLDVILDWVRQIMVRYRGKIATWVVVDRVGTPKSLGLTEEEQIEITARIVQVARQVDSQAQHIVQFDRPWAEWLGSNTATHQLSPLHLGDYLARAELGMSGVGLEIAPGFSHPGSHLRDLMDFSRLLDLYALLNLPLHLQFAVPSSVEDLEGGASIQSAQWPTTPTEETQAAFLQKWVSLAVSKPFVRSVTMVHLQDHPAQLYPHAGLIRPDGRPKPIMSWLKNFREEHLTRWKPA